MRCTCLFCHWSFGIGHSQQDVFPQRFVEHIRVFQRAEMAGVRHDDSARTAGLASGPGPGPEALGMPNTLTGDDVTLAKLRAVYSAYPTSDTARLIEYYESKR
jgi:hypothetical protein